jgi:GEVED domain/Ig-like domain CHU_C associated
MKRISLFLSFFLCTLIGLAQTVTVGTGALTATGGTNGNPIYRSSAASTFNFSQSVHLYTATQLNGAGITAGSTIDAMGFWKTDANTLAAGRSATLNIYVKNSAATALVNNQNLATWTAGATLVYSNTNVTSADLGPIGANMFTFTAPFPYAGGNLEVVWDWAINTGTGSASTGAFGWSYDSSPVIQAAGTSAGAAITGNLTTTNLRTYRANFTYTPGAPCSGFPAPGNTTGPATICSGTNFTLGLQNIPSGSGITYQWESADDAGFTVNVASLGTGLTQVTSQTSAKYYRCNVSCGANTTASTPLNVTMNSFLDCYCGVGLTTSGGAGDIITNVTMGGINNTTSGAAPWYVAFNNTPEPILQASIVPISITFGTDGAQHSAIWIDFDQNGTFDASENLALSTVAAAGSSTVTYNLVIPSSGPIGLTRMRVRGAGDGPYTAAGACIGQAWGETEDYLVDIQANVLCSGTPNPGATISSQTSVCVGTPINLSLTSSTSGSGVSFVWQSADDAAFTVNVATLASTLPSATVASQSSAKYYRCLVTCSNGPVTGISTPVLVAQNVATACYCTPIYTSGISSGDLISNVVITGTTLSNNTGTATTPNISYTFFGPPTFTAPNYTANLIAGNTYNVVVTIGSFSSQGLKAWIDYNDNGVFETTEVIGNTTSTIPTAFGTGTFPITIACNPPIGTHRMRIREVWNNAGPGIDPCISYGWGETEDYLVTIDPPLACPAPSALAAAPTAGGANVTWNAGCSELNWNAHVTSVGGGAPAGPASNPGLTATSLAVSGLDPATQYEVWVQANCEPTEPGDGTSTWVGPVVFTTTATCFPPTALVVSNITPTDAEVNFTAPVSGSPAGYSYFVSTSATAPAVSVPGTPITGPGATQTTLGNALIPNTTHFVWVRSNCGNMPVSGNPNNSAWSLSASFTTLDIPCSGTPAPGAVSPASACAGASVTLNLQNPTLGSGISYQWFDGATSTAIPGANSATYTTPAIVGGEMYYCEVTCATGPTTGASSTVTIGLSSFIDCYCTSVPSFDADEEIYSVTVNSGSTDPAYAGTNGCTTAAPGPGSILGRYSSFTTIAPITTINPGQTVSFSINQDECDGPTYYANGIGIWVDFNQNGVFTDLGEDVFIEAVTATGPRTVTGTFVVPAGATIGNTVMRVISAEGFSGTGLIPCLSYGYGETEDHLITIAPSTASMNVIAFIEGYYNPSSSPAAMVAASYDNLLNAGSPTPGNPTDVSLATIELWPDALGATYTATAMMNTTGLVSVTFPAAAIGGTYWIAITTPNTLRTFSAGSIVLSSNNTYNFSTSLASAATDGSSDPMATLVVGSLYGVRSGDINQDEFIDGTDYSVFELDVNNSANGQYSLASDLNGDTFVDGSDYPIFDLNSSSGYYTQYPSFL